MPKDPANAPQPPDPPPSPVAFCRIVLTPTQRVGVREQTGREMDFVDIPDDDGFFGERMPFRTPDDVHVYAVRHAEELNAWDAEMHAYLVALAIWQDEEEDEEQVRLEATEEEAVDQAEKLQADALAFYSAEAVAQEDARAEALDAWDPKGKKRKKQERR